MSTTTRPIFILVTVALIATLLLVPDTTTSLPLRFYGGRALDAKPAPYLFMESEFIHSVQQSELIFAQRRYFRDVYGQATDKKQYDRALAYTDSLIYLTEHHPVTGLRFYNCYKNRARMLQLMQRDSEACYAFDRATLVTDSLIRFEQNDAIQAMQESYDLDRLALDRALRKAHHYKLTLIAVILLLLVITIGVGFIFVSRRHTRLLRRELQQQMKEARLSEQKKTAFINSMCHEVRTPLNSIAGFSALLCDSHVTPNNHTQYSNIIQENRKQLREIFDDILEVAYLETLTTPLPHHHIDLCELCQTQLLAVTERHSKPEVTPITAIPTTPIQINTNEKYLRILLTALLHNAYKFTTSGTVTLECGHASNGRFFIAVADTGCGIPPEQYNYVFERFTKINTFSPGNGLGLYLCRLIAQNLHGEIHIDSNYTVGTRFVVTLPRH
ncbi:MAG: HAMP domain-containing sensor histidine kinase [Alistipes sp.]